MDLSFSSIFTDMVIGSIGLFLLLYGRNTSKPLAMFIGAGLCVLPYFVTNLVLVSILTIAALIPVWHFRHG
jgi:hypothetical protein